VTPAGAERRVRVEPASAPAYDVRIGAGILRRLAGDLPELLGAAPGRVFVALDAGVPGAFSAPLLDGIRAGGAEVSCWTIDPTERVKSLETLGVLLEKIAASRLERREPVIAVGGGIVGDIAGYAAASYRRGVPVIQCPTTLLAAVDASVGGKTGVNLSIPGDAGGSDLLKNMAGAFHQPVAVVADVLAFASLPDRELRAGLAECVKHGTIAGDWGDPDLFAWTRRTAAAVLARDEAALIECVERNVGVKARVVAADERERSDTGGRALLNMGHTYAHAMETLDGVGASGPDGPLEPPLLHGEAVGLGLIAAAACSRAMGRVGDDDVASVRDAVNACGLPTAVSGLPGDDALVARMAHDKKASGGRLRLTLLRSLGRGELISGPPLEAVSAGWSAIRA
jgi:3-dehydroquinate synthetase